MINVRKFIGSHEMCNMQLSAAHCSGRLNKFFWPVGKDIISLNSTLWNYYPLPESCGLYKKRAQNGQSSGQKDNKN